MNIIFYLMSSKSFLKEVTVEELNLIQEVTKDPGLIILTGLLRSELEVIQANYPDDLEGVKLRIVYWIYKLKEIQDNFFHSGDCTNQSVPCDICIVCSDFKATNGVRAEVQNLSLEKLIEIVIVTQPKNRFSSYQEFMDQITIGENRDSIQSFNIYRKLTQAYYRTMVSRVKEYEDNLSFTRFYVLSFSVTELIEMVNKCMKLDKHILFDWWRKGGKLSDLNL